MGLIRTLVARCDVESCGRTLTLNPDTTQPYRTLVEGGWRLENAEDDIRTICPRHTES